jgi:hypothetical protein
VDSYERKEIPEARLTRPGGNSGRCPKCAALLST